jgi:hypothetical protein
MTYMSVHELRDRDQARNFIQQGLCLQRRLTPVAPAVVRPALEWALDIASSGEPLPPVGFVADLGVELFDFALGQKRSRTDQAPLGLPPALVRAYEDHVFGKVFADWRFDRAKDALKRYTPGRERARGLAFLINQFRRRAPFDGVLLSPAILRSLIDAAPEETLRRGQESLARDGLMPLLDECYRSMVTAARQTAEVLGEADVRALENRIALADESQRLAHDQVMSAMIELRDALPRHGVKPLEGRHEVPTRVLDEDTYPVGGFTSISTRGSVESLLHSQLAYMEDKTRPDLFDIKFVRDELYYYSRDENQFLRRRRSFVVALYPDLVNARFKDPDSRFQRIVYLLGLIVAAAEKLTDWLSADALQFDFVFLHEDGSFPLKLEFELLEMLFREQVANGIVRLFPSKSRPNDDFAQTHTPEELADHCRRMARRSLCHLLAVSMQDRPQQIEDTTIARLMLSNAQPTLVHATDDSATPSEWPAALEKLLQLWV